MARAVRVPAASSQTSLPLDDRRVSSSTPAVTPGLLRLRLSHLIPDEAMPWTKNPLRDDEDDQRWQRGDEGAGEHCVVFEGRRC